MKQTSTLLVAFEPKILVFQRAKLFPVLARSLVTGLLIYLFIYLSIYLVIYLFIYLFIYVFIYLFIYLFIYIFIYLFVYLCIYPFIYLYVYFFLFQWLHGKLCPSIRRTCPYRMSRVSFVLFLHFPPFSGSSFFTLFRNLSRSVPFTHLSKLISITNNYLCISLWIVRHTIPRLITGYITDSFLISPTCCMWRQLTHSNGRKLDHYQV
jgi:hypothetical protein